MQFHALSVEQSLASLKTTAAGLSAVEAARRLAEFGPNHVEEVGREPSAAQLRPRIHHFFAIILWIGAALAFLAEHFDPGQGMARLGVAIVGVIIVNGIFSFWQEYKAEQAVAALRPVVAAEGAGAAWRRRSWRCSPPIWCLAISCCWRRAISFRPTAA